MCTTVGIVLLLPAMGGIVLLLPAMVGVVNPGRCTTVGVVNPGMCTTVGYSLLPALNGGLFPPSCSQRWELSTRGVHNGENYQHPGCAQPWAI